MKKIAIACALLTSFVASSVWADAASDLKSRLDKVSSFHASFTQKVTDGSGNAVQEGQGDLWVKRPNLFNWHMTQPDESILVSDGKTLWFFNPFVEQATATWLKDATSNTPFMCRCSNIDNVPYHAINEATAAPCATAITFSLSIPAKACATCCRCSARGFEARHSA